MSALAIAGLVLLALLAALVVGFILLVCWGACRIVRAEHDAMLDDVPDRAPDPGPDDRPGPERRP